MTQDTDRELLELAAKAAGITLMGFKILGNGLPTMEHGIWNPLTDDGDALRLLAKLGMDLLVEGYTVEVIAGKHSREVDGVMTAPWSWEKLSDDPYAATRRAIVRAAAEIGRSMA